MALKITIPASISLKTFWILFTGLVILRFLFPRFGTHDVTAFLSYDVASHYLWLPAFFIHDDLGIHNFGWVEQILRHYQPFIGYRQAFLQTGTPDQVFTSSMGTAMLFSPFFITGHFFALISGMPADGFSYPYQVAMAAGGLCWSALGLWLLRKLLLSHFSEKISAITMIVIVAATGYANLAAFNGAAHENLLFTLYAALLLLSSGCLIRPGYGTAIGTGLIAGFIFLIRPFDIVVMMPWIGYMAIRIFRKHTHLAAFMVFIFVSTAFLQIIYWKIFTGHHYYNTGTVLPGSSKEFIPYIVLGSVLLGFLIRYLAGKKSFVQYALLFICCCFIGINLCYSIGYQVKLNQYPQAPAGAFFSYDREAAIPDSLRFSARTYVKEETEVMNHPEWFKTRRIYTLPASTVKLNEWNRFSPGINAPLSDFSTKPWIGLRARAMVFCSGPTIENSGNLVMTLLRDEKAFNWMGAPVNGKTLKAGQWNEVTLNYLIKDAQVNDRLQTYLWYTGSQQILLGSLTVTLYEINHEDSTWKNLPGLFSKNYLHLNDPANAD